MPPVRPGDKVVLSRPQSRVATQHRPRGPSPPWGGFLIPSPRSRPSAAGGAPTMDESGFLQALFEDPADDTSRLIFADWLDERGDPRGELLRVQRELDGWVPDLGRRTALQQRERQLLSGWFATWPDPLRQRCREWQVEG